MFAMLVGDTFKPIGKTTDKQLSFAPWGKGVYWVLACDDTTCWVVAGMSA